ncbi:hypothetical protein [Burkholderia sp. LMG 13014]|uniref:hypothetical protein n=1 Tax=Burkholderia sp. LMG 13014 TaxID=2709306 RepID=UPI001964148D|nr:hypothetical protein [Burkholderia sp. LMG 13014]
MKTINDFIDIAKIELNIQFNEDFLEDTTKQVYEGNYVDDAHRNDLLQLNKGFASSILRNKSDCSEALDAYIAYFNKEMEGSEWSMERMSYRACGHPRSILTLKLPKEFADRSSMIFSLDQDGISGLATPKDLLFLGDAIEQCKDRIFHDKLIIDMNKKEAPTGTRRQKI